MASDRRRGRRPAAGARRLIGFARALALLLAVAGGPALAADRLGAIVAGSSGDGPPLAGLAVVVADRRGVVRAEARGLADIAAARPLRPDTLVRVASVSKLVVVLGVLRLVEQRRLDLDADVSPLLGFTLRHPRFPDRPITLRLLIGHRAGLGDATAYRLPLGTSLETGLKAATWGPSAPGARFDYANINFGVIATVMEAATGERFDRLMQRLVLAPMRLDACFNWQGCTPAAIAAAATLYRRGIDETAWNPAGPWIAQVDADGARPAGGCPVARATDTAPCALAAYRPGTNGTLFSPQGGLRISALGLARIGRMLLGGGTIDGRRILRPASVDALFASAPVGATGGNYDGLMRRWGLIQCMGGDGATGGDQPLSPHPTAWCGHMGEAYGLLSGLWIDRAADRAYVYALTGLGDDPAALPARRSKFMRVEEAILAEITARP